LRICIRSPTEIIRAVVGSDAVIVRRSDVFNVLRMWGIVAARSSSRHHSVTCSEHVVSWGEPLVHSNSLVVDTWDGHRPGTPWSSVACFVVGVWALTTGVSAHTHASRICSGWTHWTTNEVIRELFMPLVSPNNSLSFRFPTILKHPIAG
jgi:hypothetical protein